MIRETAALAELDAADARAVVHRRSYYEALDVMLALWDEARALNERIGDDWRADIAADIEVARTLNALRPTNSRANARS